MTAMKASSLERDVERSLAGPLDRREAVHSSWDFEPARIRRGSAICAEVRRPRSLVPAASKKSPAVASSRQVDWRLASPSGGVHAMGADGMGARL
jgi:hypothetical protein